jgi:DNA mismatch endonuclease (patch repair protein)
MFVRRLLYRAGFRYRLHVPGLAGKPDLVFSARKKVIFIHGCFWHMHEGCGMSRLPKSRVEFWRSKLNANKERDARNLTELEAAGWEVLTVWECELREPELLDKMVRFLHEPLHTSHK